MTSPPYWGLRDYGTAEWEGGGPECDHVARSRPPTKGSSSTLGVPADGGPRRIGDDNSYHEAYTEQYRDTCRKCGATRIDAQIGLEPTPEQYVENLVAVFREVRRVLTDDGTLWLNLGDSYNGVGRGTKANGLQVAARATAQRTVTELKPKDLVGIPWRVAFALQADGWWLRSDIIWAKPNPMPESVTDRPTKSHEYLFLLSKSGRYFYDADAIAERMKSDYNFASWDERKKNGATGGCMDRGGNQQHGNGTSHDLGSGTHRNRRSVWTINTKPFPEAHFATFPLTLPMLCIQAGTSAKGGCVECGAPMERRVVAIAPDGREAEVVGGKAYDENGRPLMGDNMIDHGVRGSWNSGGKTLKRETRGWKSSCDCDAGTKPDTVLDPFAGAGTTGVAATKLCREFVGIELNPEYAAMAERRIMGTPLALELAP